MTDPILLARIDALSENLSRVKALDWYDNTPFLAERTQLRDQIEDTIALELRVRDEGLATLRRDVEAANPVPEEMWIRYKRLYDESQAIFTECLTFIGALAFRAMELDQKIWHVAACDVADELIRACARASIGDWYSLTVPAPEEALTQTLARIIRLRFPEWTIWTLPLTAHEYGHVVARIARNERGTLLEHMQRTLRRGGHDVPEEQHLEELTADAFATLTMGPAYACAVIQLRLDPTRAWVTDALHPSEGQRAEVVLGTLKRMSNRGVTNPYRSTIDRLEEEWNAVTNRFASGDPRPAASMTEAIVGAAWDSFGALLRASACYPATAANEGWTKACHRSQQWRDALGNREELPSLAANSTLRDVLNAAWIFRMTTPDLLHNLGGWPNADCHTVLASRRKFAADEGPGRQILR
jgi:hypothetical protein